MSDGKNKIREVLYFIPINTVGKGPLYFNVIFSPSKYRYYT